jgi:ATP-dependent helicase HrpA
MDRLDIYNGSLYPALEKAMLLEYQMSITRDAWRTDTLPQHLLMRYQLVEDRGKPIRSSRRFSELLACLQETPLPDAGNGADNNTDKVQLPEKRGMTDWDFKDLPLRVSKKTKTGESKLYFPALSVNDQVLVDLSYMDDEKKARQQTRLGMHVLYCRQFPGSRKQLIKECKASLAAHSASWLSLGMAVPARQLREALMQFVLDGLFDTGEGLIPELTRFNEIVATLKKEGLLKNTAIILKTLTEVLAIRRQVATNIAAWADKNFDPVLENEFRKCLTNILPADFLLTRSHSQLIHTARYLRALTIRVERAGQNPIKDEQKQKRLTTAVNRLAQVDTFPCHNAACRQVIARYRTMVEEFRVSVFAPELGTVIPVSEKRLTKLWQEVENHCRQVE